MALTPEETARWMALRCVTKVISHISDTPTGVVASFWANPFHTQETKRMAQKELEKISWDLTEEYNRLDVRIGTDN